MRKVRQERKGILVQLEQREQWVQQGRKVRLALKVQSAMLERQDHKVQLDLKVSLEQQVRQEHKVQQLQLLDKPSCSLLSVQLYRLLFLEPHLVEQALYCKWLLLEEVEVAVE